jgi:predicted dehydrogenase
MGDHLRVAVIGAGTRGTALARHAAAQGAAVAAVAEPDRGRREAFAREFALPAADVLASWEAMEGRDLACDAAIITTLDNQHTGPALASLRRGWHLLLEKPMAATLEDCLAIEDAQRGAGVVLSVCHTLRHLDSYRTLKALIAGGALGRVMHIEHMEAIGHRRFAHNYVRGRWAREARNTFLLLHKCCHDLDLVSWLAAAPCRRVASFGGLAYFRPERAPAGSAARCLDCGLGAACLYSARRLYLEGDLEAWPARDVSAVHTPEAHLEAVRGGPYGACIWRTDNDVVDHQTVLLEFAGDATATVTLSGFSASNGRRTRVQGDRGELFYDEALGILEVTCFDGSPARRIACVALAGYHPEDAEIVRDWLQAIANPGEAHIAVDAREALRGHTVVFAAERARLEGRVVELE